MEKNDLNSVIAGLAGLGEIYLRISDKIRSLYEKDPKLKFEAELLMAKAGYAKAPLMKDLVDDLLGLHSAFASSMSDRILLRTYGDKFNDIVLLQETVNEFAAAGDEKKETLRERIRRQLSIFPDPDLGCGDLARFGYRYVLSIFLRYMFSFLREFISETVLFMSDLACSPSFSRAAIFLSREVFSFIKR